ncbi:MAG TPA: TIGR04255 family protein [Actinomycetota bacterium]|nr:TIGR04255 family protein [Actinomycetota bacterium]
MDEHEVYPNAPLRLVAHEVRYPLSPRLGTQDQLAVFLEALDDLLPVAEMGGEQGFVLSVGGASSVSTPPIRSVFKLASRDRTTVATVSGTNTTIETTSYRSFTSFLPLANRVFGVLAESGLIVGMERVGLRYIDEIRVPSLESGPNMWTPYVQSALIDQIALGVNAAQLIPQSWQGAVNYSTEENQSVVLRYGAMEGFAVNQDGPLRVPKRTSPGPFFLIDIDSFWAAAEVTNGMDLDWLMNLSVQLHRPIRDLFEAAITDKLRDDVLRKVVST